MNDRPATDLDGFEAALLLELHAELQQPATAGPQQQPRALPPRWRARGRWQIAAVTAAAALAVALLVPGLGPVPAFAVTGRDNGEVHVKVNRLKGAAELEQALRKHGIVADITYLPPNKMCAAGRYTAVRTPGLALAVAAYKFDVTIPANAVGEDDTFVLDASVTPLPDASRPGSTSTSLKAPSDPAGSSMDLRTAVFRASTKPQPKSMPRRRVPRAAAPFRLI